MASKVESKSNAMSSPEAASGRSTLGLGLLGALLCYLAHPPVGLSLLAWIGPAPWLLLVRLPKLPGRRPYRAVWLAGMACWAATVQWIRLPHWANHFGLIFLAAYLGAYLPAFIGLTRVAVHRLRLPLWLAAPVAWTGLEWIRARLLTGFLMASLAHTQVRFPIVIQIADICGEYGVTFLMMLVAASVAAVIPKNWLDRISAPGSAGGSLPPGQTAPTMQRDPRPEAEAAGWRIGSVATSLAIAVLAVSATLGYGYWRLNQEETAGSRTGPRIALIQSDMLADWKGTADRDAAEMKDMFELSQRAVAAANGPVDLVVWPETMYRDPFTMLDDKNGPPAQMFDPAELNAARNDLAMKAAKLNSALLVGVDRLNLLAGDESAAAPDGFRYEGYNSAVLVDRTGNMVGTYDKMHLLPFGEFIPFIEWLPFLLDISPVTGTAVPGRLPEPLFLGDVQYSVNICYETVLPQLIRQQFLHAISRTSAAPDVMVNLTNDAWYWGSSELDMHLASGVFRAVEMRTPLVIAANRGLSAYVDTFGRVVQVTDRDKSAFLIADVKLPARHGAYPSLFAAYGEWLAILCLLSCIVFAAAGWHGRRSRRAAKRK
jgi:apolipoprotein N-acyltransferase